MTEEKGDVRRGDNQIKVNDLFMIKKGGGKYLFKDVGARVWVTPAETETHLDI